MEPPKCMSSSDTPVQTNKKAASDAVDLEFPDWNGMEPRYARKTFAESVRWNDEMLSKFPRRKRSPELEAERRCDVEFVL